MKEITLKIPEQKLDFFMELFKYLDVKVVSETEIPEWHKEEVRKRINDSRAEDLIPWDEVRDKLTSDKEA